MKKPSWRSPRSGMHVPSSLTISSLCTSEIVRTDSADPATQAEATAVWRLTVKDSDERKVGRAFSDAMIHTALASIPGMYGLGGGPSTASPYGVYRPATISADLVPQHVQVLGGSNSVVEASRPETTNIHRPIGLVSAVEDRRRPDHQSSTGNHRRCSVW